MMECMRLIIGEVGMRERERERERERGTSQQNKAARRHPSLEMSRRLEVIFGKDHLQGTLKTPSP